MFHSFGWPAAGRILASSPPPVAARNLILSSDLNEFDVMGFVTANDLSVNSTAGTCKVVVRCDGLLREARIVGCDDGRLKISLVKRSNCSTVKSAKPDGSSPALSRLQATTRPR